MAAGMYAVPKAERRTMELLTALGLADKADAYVRQLSGGMKRRLMVAKAMVHNPPVLILDEPTAGVDVELRRQLWEHVLELNRRGTTVLLTTHYLEEAEKLCDTIAIINHGQVVACDSTRALVGQLDRKTVTLLVDRELTAVPPALAVLPVEGAVELENGRRLVVRYRPSRVRIDAILDAVRADGLGLVDITTEEGDLEDIFLTLTRGDDDTHRQGSGGAIDDHAASPAPASGAAA